MGVYLEKKPNMMDYFKKGSITFLQYLQQTKGTSQLSRRILRNLSQTAEWVCDSSNWTLSEASWISCITVYFDTPGSTGPHLLAPSLSSLSITEAFQLESSPSGSAFNLCLLTVGVSLASVKLISLEFYIS